MNRHCQLNVERSVSLLMFPYQLLEILNVFLLLIVAVDIYLIHYVRNIDLGTKCKHV
jgi:hypothetical protein